MMARFLDGTCGFCVGYGDPIVSQPWRRSLPSRGVAGPTAKARTIRQRSSVTRVSRGALYPGSIHRTPRSVERSCGAATTEEYRHGPIVPMLFQWPTDTEDGRSSLVLEGMAQRPMGIEKNSGPWSLFRLFDLLQGEPSNGRDARLLKADIGGLRAHYLLTSQRTPNPFEMATWDLPHTGETMSPWQATCRTQWRCVEPEHPLRLDRGFEGALRWSGQG